MQIAITSDLHLRSQSETPHRFKALQNILDQMIGGEITELLIAGDLFDKDASNYSDFEKLISDDKYKDIQLRIIRGNHDLRLRDNAFVSDNIDVIDSAGIFYFGDSSIPFLMIPYQEEVSMGEVIAEFVNDLPKDNWILVGHGDYLESVRDPESYEKGIYMPLSRKDVSQFSPLQAFLGHIHKPSEIGKVIYMGSPNPIQINETGARRFIIFDTQELTHTSHRVTYGAVNFIEDIMILPIDDETSLLSKQLDQVIREWQDKSIDPQEVVLRLKISGYTKSRKDLQEYLEGKLKDMGIGTIESVNLDKLHSLETEPERIELANLAQEHMSTQDWSSGDTITPSKNEVMLQIQKLIFES